MRYNIFKYSEPFGETSVENQIGSVFIFDFDGHEIKPTTGLVLSHDEKNYLSLKNLRIITQDINLLVLAETHLSMKQELFFWQILTNDNWKVFFNNQTHIFIFD